jgi:tRNA pseudouridine-54 N-methylase
MTDGIPGDELMTNFIYVGGVPLNLAFLELVQYSTDVPSRHIRLMAYEIKRLRADNERMRSAIQKVLDDEESGTGWGPDITTCAYLANALQEKS